MRRTVALAALAVAAASCGLTSSSTAVEGITITTTSGAAATSSNVATTIPSTTLAATITAAPAPELDLTIEPSGWEDVRITAEDGIDLYARYWDGGDRAVLFGHDFDNPTPGSAGQRAPQSSESILAFSAAIAREGYTVLSMDYRGHGQSEGEYDVRASQLDLAAAYRWLADQGHDEVVMVGFAGSGTAAVVLDAESDDIDFAGIAMLFSPPQDTGLDANAVLPAIEAPMFFVGSEAGQSASWANRLEAKATNSSGVFIFDRVPSGVTFFDVFGAELAGRIAQFIASI